MSELLEQASDIIAEDNLPQTEIPAYISICKMLTEPLNPDTINVRCFYTVEGKVFLGLVFAETQDSFLVGTPARLIMDEYKQVKAEPLGSEPVIRWMKSSTLYMTDAQPRSRYYYYTFLRDSGRIHLADYLTDKRLVEINNYIEETEKQPDFSVGTAPSSAKKEAPGATSKSFRPLIVSEKIH